MTVKDDPQFLMAERDWVRIRRCVASIKDPSSWAGNLGWLLLGVGFSILLSLIPWQASRGDLATAAERESWGWVTPTFWAAAGASFVVALISFVYQGSMKNQPRLTAEQIIEDMDGVHPPPPPPPPPGLVRAAIRAARAEEAGPAPIPPRKAATRKARKP